MTVSTLSIGTWRGVALELAAWDGAGATVDLSVACLFEHEPDGIMLQGGAKHLDAALGGALLRLREEGRFRARLGETLLIDRPPAGVAGATVLVVGLGDPATWTPAASGLAAGVATSCALARGARSAALAPSLLDAGVAGGNAAAAMLEAVAAAIDAAQAAAEAKLATAPSLRRFVFDAGPAHLDKAAHAFAQAFVTLPGLKSRASST